MGLTIPKHDIYGGGSYDPAAIYDQLVQTGEAWADKESAAALLEEMRKPVLAALKGRTEAKSDAAAEALALASHEYAEHIRKMIDARHAATVARVKYDATRALADALRTRQATMRAEAGLAGMSRG